MNTDAIRLLNHRFESAYPEDVLSWASESFGPKAAVATGFGSSGVVLMHMLSRITPQPEVFYLDTDLLYPQTYDLKRRLGERLNIRFTRVHSGISLPEQANLEGERLWRTNPDRCCFLRKVQPLRKFLRGRDAWVTGIRRDQAPTRATAELFEWDASNDLLKINPLVGWSSQAVWRYIELYNLPYNPLHDRGYSSVGCIPCTRAVRDDEHVRAGRWPEHAKLECGIHAVTTSSRRIPADKEISNRD